MDTEIRHCITYIAGCLITGHEFTGLHDPAAGQSHSFSGVIDTRRVDIHDWSRYCRVSGTAFHMHDDELDAAISAWTVERTFGGLLHDSGALFYESVEVRIVI